MSRQKDDDTHRVMLGVEHTFYMQHLLWKLKIIKLKQMKVDHMELVRYSKRIRHMLNWNEFLEEERKRREKVL